MTPNRLVAVALAVCGFAAAVLPVAANLDWTSTRGVLGGLAAITAAAVTWLLGWQKHEARQPLSSAPATPAKPKRPTKTTPNADIPVEP